MKVFPEKETSNSPNDSQEQRSDRRLRDLTKGSIPRNFWYLSWPQMAESFLSVIDQLADPFSAGRVGYRAIAGMGISQTYIMMLMTARMGLDASMRGMVSRAIGAGDTDYANHVLTQSIILTAPRYGA